jgi:hypothetical protein
MIGFIDTSFTITLNHNQFTTAHNKSSVKPLTAEDSLHSRSRSTAGSSYNCQLTWNSALYSLGADITENTCHVTRIRVYWPVAQHLSWRGPPRKHFFQYFSLVACAYFGRCLQMVYMSQYAIESKSGHWLGTFKTGDISFPTKM